jgi:glycosyltransferase involved in cell wall biosynthesis
MVFNQGRRDILTVIIGDGDATPQLRSLAKELNVEQFVLFTGRISDALVRSYLSSVHVCVQPDPSNPLNDRSTMNKVMEYMALERPIVAFDLPETRYSAQGSALYARPNDVGELANHILHLLDHPEQRRQMGQLGRQRFSTALAWEHSVPYLLEAYSVGLGLGSATAEATE